MSAAGEPREQGQVADAAGGGRIGEERDAFLRRADALHLAEDVRLRGPAQEQVDARTGPLAQPRRCDLAAADRIAAERRQQPALERGLDEPWRTRRIEADPRGRLGPRAGQDRGIPGAPRRPA